MYYGLSTADMPSKQLIHWTVGDRRVCVKLSKVDVLIWDEASMSSGRMIELANALRHHLSCEENSICWKTGHYCRGISSTAPGSELFWYRQIHVEIFEHTIAHCFELESIRTGKKVVYLEHLVRGTEKWEHGDFQRREKDSNTLQVQFKYVKTVNIKWETWDQRNCEGETINIQFPNVLPYAVTC